MPKRHVHIIFDVFYVVISQMSNVNDSMSQTILVDCLCKYFKHRQRTIIPVSLVIELYRIKLIESIISSMPVHRIRTIV